MHHSHGQEPLIFISAAEPSADLHGAALIRATRRARPGARFVGVAGPKMVAAGCDPIFDMTPHSAMLLGAIRAVGRGIRLLQTADRHLRRYPFDAAVVIDSPTLHLPLAARAQAVGVPVLYYIAPQLWAWGAYRIHRLRNQVDRVAVIFPFEECYFREQGVCATYVGHPLAEQCAQTRVDDDVVAGIRADGSPVVALLPGSRKHVVQTVIGDQLDIAERIAAAFPRASFGVSVANVAVRPVIEEALNRARHPAKPYLRNRSELIAAADLVLVASGTAALEVAFQQRPMIVMYNASRLFYHLVARWLIHTPYLSLPNILAGRRIVPEFMPYYTSTAPIADRAIELLGSGEQREEMIRNLAETVEPLQESQASRRTAVLLLDMIDQR